MNLRINRKNFFLLLFQGLLLLVSLILFSNEELCEFLTLCRLSLLLSVIAFLPLVYVQKKVFTEINIFYISFTLFQLGLPFIYGIIPNYYNYYMGLFSENILIDALRYSILSNEVAALAILIGLCFQNKKGMSYYLRITNEFDRNTNAIAKYGFILFVITGAIVLPITGYTAIRQFSSGIFILANREVMSQNGLLRFAQEFFYSSALVVICFESRNSIRRKIAIVGYFLASIIMMTLADRAQGLIAIFVYIYYVYQSNKKKDIISRISNIKFVFYGIAILFVMVFIANARGRSTTSNNILLSFISELGFNFTSICFVMELVPVQSAFRYGLTYLAAFIRLIPSSIDFLGITSLPEFETGEMWLWNYNHIHRNYLDFGVGFSLNAESYLNFSWAGLIAILFIVLIVTRLLNEKKEGNWHTYVRLILLMDILLLPRRQVFTLTKSIEYSIVFMGLYLLFLLRLKRKKN